MKYNPEFRVIHYNHKNEYTDAEWRHMDSMEHKFHHCVQFILRARQLIKSDLPHSSAWSTANEELKREGFSFDCTEQIEVHLDADVGNEPPIIPSWATEQDMCQKVEIRFLGVAVEDNGELNYIMYDVFTDEELEAAREHIINAIKEHG